MSLNERALALAEALAADADRCRVTTASLPGGGRLLDAGVVAPGGLEAGLCLARICLAGLGEVSLVPARPGLSATLDVMVRSDHPLPACLGSQYAGWQIAVGDFFAMGSGPMRAIAGREPLLNDLNLSEEFPQALGVLETDRLPDDEVFAHLGDKLSLPPDDITLVVASVTSLAGMLQVVARSLETALHKLHQLGFDLTRVVSGAGVAPLPPPGGKALSAMGRSNDAILYGGEVTLWVRGDDASLSEVGPRIPSSASRDFGRPFEEIFARYDRDFYKIDPQLFSPAVVTLVNLDTGRSQRFGKLSPEVLAKSCGK